MEAGVETGKLAGADDGGKLAGHIYAVYVRREPSASSRCRAMTETMAMVSLLRT